MPPGPHTSEVLESIPFHAHLNVSTASSAAIISFRVYNRRIIVLNSATAVHELLEQRAATYSDRPKSWMFQEICGRKKAVFNISSSDARHKLYRKFMHASLNAHASRNYWPLLQFEAGRLLDALASSPDKYEQHIRA
jgi:cytochrome P450